MLTLILRHTSFETNVLGDAAAEVKRSERLTTSDSACSYSAWSMQNMLYMHEDMRETRTGCTNL